MYVFPSEFRHIVVCPTKSFIVLTCDEMNFDSSLESKQLWGADVPMFFQPKILFFHNSLTTLRYFRNLMFSFKTNFFLGTRKRETTEREEKLFATYNVFFLYIFIYPVFFLFKRQLQPKQVMEG